MDAWVYCKNEDGLQSVLMKGFEPEDIEDCIINAQEHFVSEGVGYDGAVLILINGGLNE